MRKGAAPERGLFRALVEAGREPDGGVHAAS